MVDFQRFNQMVYGVANDRHYTTGDLVVKLLRYANRTLKSVRKGNHSHLPYTTAMAFSWATAIGNRLHLYSLDNEIWERFPFACPYCGGLPCDCKTRAETRKVFLVRHTRPATITEYQNMFRSIYPQNTLTDSAIHLSEEVSEVAEALLAHSGYHSEKMLEEVRLELVDVFSCLFAVSSSYGIVLAEVLETCFKDGCTKCHKIPCICGFVAGETFPAM